MDPRGLLNQLGIDLGDDDVRIEDILPLLEMMGLGSMRKRLPQYSTLEHAVDLIRSKQRIIVLSGAGISVSCGIPDFRSHGGFYEKVQEAGFERPEEIFDIELFRQRPEVFYRFARDLMPTGYTPSPTHFFIASLDEHSKLLRTYTQNIDNLEAQAGATHVLQCHGSMGSATCIECGHKVPIAEIAESTEDVPLCTHCDKEKRYLKPDVVFFGESLPSQFHQQSPVDFKECDLLLVMGSSLKVNPVAGLIRRTAPEVPQILINREVVGPPNHFDIHLIGNCDVVCAELARRLGWELPYDRTSSPDLPTRSTGEDGSYPSRFEEPNHTLFEGALSDELSIPQPSEGEASSQTTSSPDAQSTE
eukprot:gnl/Trimastix_PCT/3197.p1 GENE.gnl/Trimastix_PCT/3197~~gnl/Trimastix_PCT/3197.p1  ORF type:complete len:361 (-),score=105.05 gnl/Trimastix_PCT/3197:140-1222(-)